MYSVKNVCRLILDIIDLTDYSLKKSQDLDQNFTTAAPFSCTSPKLFYVNLSFTVFE